jgi:hypothetical protein
MKRLLAIVGAFIIGGITVAIGTIGPQAAEAGYRLN